MTFNAIIHVKPYYSLMPGNGGLLRPAKEEKGTTCQDFRYYIAVVNSCCEAFGSVHKRMKPLSNAEGGEGRAATPLALLFEILFDMKREGRRSQVRTIHME